MSMDKPPAINPDDTLCVCIACEKARFGAELWDELNMESLLNPSLEITHGLCPVCEKRLHHSLGLLSRYQAF